MSSNSAISNKQEPPSASTKPNIVMFFVDDLGWADLGYRNSQFESPNIDKLAAESLDFQSMYIPTATCSPSRAALVTGQHPARLEFFRHIPTNTDKAFDAFGRTQKKYNLWSTDPGQVPSINWLDNNYVTYAEALKKLGYYNMFVGKWHIGHDGHHPTDQGFDKQIGTTNWGNPKAYNAPFFRPGTPTYQKLNQGYLTDKLTEDTSEFITNHDSSQPFMLSVWYYSVHSPFDGRPDLVKHFKEKGLKGKQAHYAAMVKSVDMSVGRIRETLADKGIADNTIILFLSDQGGAFKNGPLRGGKYEDTLYEGGSRVPFIVNWPNITQAASVNHSLVQSTDIFPTIVEIAGGDPSQYINLNGTSLLSTIKHNTKLQRNKPLFGYRAYNDSYATVRLGDWKLIAFRSGKTELYNIAKDIGETQNISKQNTAKVKQLTNELIQWEKEVNIEKYSGFQ